MKSRKSAFILLGISFIFIFGMLFFSDLDKVNHEGEARTPSGSIILKGDNYLEVIDTFKEAGFINIRTEVIEDLILGWLTKDGEVESVSVDGNIDYSPDDWYPPNVEVVITYHTFSKPDPEVVVDFPKENAMRSVAVAFTNYYADDVFQEDGNHYDISKFHSYADVSGFFLNIIDEGVWSEKDEETWHVEHIKLKHDFYSSIFNISVDVSFDGKVYILSDLKGSAPSYEDIGVFEDEGNFSMFFYVPIKLIEEDRVAKN